MYIFDIETLYENSLFSFYKPDENKWFEYSIDKNTNDLYRFVKFIDENRGSQFVGYNSLNFDSQVIEYILRNYEKWHDLTNLQITQKIWQKAQDIIDDTNHDLFPPYREEELTLKNIDLFKIHHFDNKSRRASLKWLEFMMDMDNIEEMPIHHNSRNLTDNQLIEIREYCKNDILATYQLYKYTIGEVEHEFYRGKNMIQYRLDIIEEGLLSEKALNYSNSKIGDELNKFTYCKLSGKSYKDLYELKKNRKPTRKFTFGEAIPDYVKFQTPELKSFYDKIKNITVSLKESDDQEFTLKFRGTTYTIARGGIHSNEKNRVIVAGENEYLEDADVGSQYPNAINKRGLYPVHLGPAWNKVGKHNIQKRAEYKKLSENNRKYKGLSEMFKEALNAGFFGKTIENTNWQYGPEVGYFCTIGNQFEILMLIEMLELEGIRCVSANTDGILCLYPKNLEQTYYNICHKWEEIVGNHELGKLEFVKFKKICQESVNHYVAIKEDGTVKKKGRFDWESQLHKNNTDKLGRIERKAIVEYFKNGTPVEQTIKSSITIFDFVRGRKSNKDYHYELVDSNGKREIFKSVVRYYITYNDKRLLKIKNENSESTGSEVIECEAPDEHNIWHIEVINRIDRNKKISDYNINYDFYVKKAEAIISKIDKQYVKKDEQLKLPF